MKESDRLSTRTGVGSAPAVGNIRFLPLACRMFGLLAFGNGVRLPTPEALVFKETSGAMDSPMKFPTIPIGDVGTHMPSSLWMVSGLVPKGMRS